ncbi:hypothetical protein BGZ70_002343, partial [Mortierella alpina]
DSCVRKKLKHRQSECWIRHPHLRRERPGRAPTGNSSSSSSSSSNHNNHYTMTPTSHLVDAAASSSSSVCRSPSPYADEALDAWCPEEDCVNRNLKHRADQCWIRHPHLRTTRSKKPSRAATTAAAAAAHAAAVAHAETIRAVRFEDPNCGEDECLQNRIVHRPEECWVRYRGVDPDLDHIVY